MALRNSARRHLFVVLVLVTLLFISLTVLRGPYDIPSIARNLPLPRPKPAAGKEEPSKPPPKPKYKPTPTFTPPPIKDPFPLLATSTPPPIPKWNRPKKNLHADYGLPVAPPLLIGFSRSWPILLQAVVSYITAGWPPSQIYVVENTGTHKANARHQLTLQNPFFLDHKALAKLGVHVIPTPVLLNFAQLQNFYLDLAIDRDWPYYFWSHMDVLALPYEDGGGGVTPRYDEPGYKSLYAMAVAALNETRVTDERWGLRFFAYDHLALVNPVAYEAVGGWDTLIPYYITDCDMHSRLAMANWTAQDRKAGIIFDVSTALDDLSVLYRVDDLEPNFTDPNPPPPPPPEKMKDRRRRQVAGKEAEAEAAAAALRRDEEIKDPNLRYWDAIRRAGDRMFHYKHGSRGRNTWQAGQRGGQGEPFHYDAEGLVEGIEVLTDAGREVFRRKWGHRDCDLITGAGLGIEDQWKVLKDWE